MGYQVYGCNTVICGIDYNYHMYNQIINQVGYMECPQLYGISLING